MAGAAEDSPNPKLVPPAPLHEQVLHLHGDPSRPVNLVVTLFTPEGTGPFPLVVMNYGSDGEHQAPADMPRCRFTMPAYYFLSRGYAVTLPMMRGYGGSGGAQDRFGFDFERLALANGADIAGVVDGLADNPLVDTSRLVVAGQSFGGWNALGMGALQLRGLRGAADFVGGAQSSDCDSFHHDAERLVEAAHTMPSQPTSILLWAPQRQSAPHG